MADGHPRRGATREALARLRTQIETSRAARQERRAVAPHLAFVRAAPAPQRAPAMGHEVRVATYNVHRWSGLNSRRADAARAGFVISQLDADVIALQEVLRPVGVAAEDDPLQALAEAMGMHVAFAVTRLHKRGALGNAILSRWPIASVSVLDLSFSRVERRVAVVAQIQAIAVPGAAAVSALPALGVVATHLALVDRTRRRQVRSLLEHPHLNSGPVVVLGDMNAWRRCEATRALDEEMHWHNNDEWPASFPAAAPVLALDRIYARRASVVSVAAHDTPAARRASDHLPVVATIRLPD